MAFSREVGNAQPFISQIIKGKRLPPKDRHCLERWARALELHGAERKHFMWLADVSRSPMEVQRAVETHRMVADDEMSYDAGVNHFGLCLCRHMEARGLSAEDLAAAIDAKPEVIAEYLAGQPPAEVDDEPLAKALGLEDLDKMEFLELASITRDVPHPPARDHFVETLHRLLDHERKIRAMKDAMGG